jgi:hypothetical protein
MIYFYYIWYESKYLYAWMEIRVRKKLAMRFRYCLSFRE